MTPPNASQKPATAPVGAGQLRLRDLARRCGQDFESFALQIKEARRALRALEMANWNKR
jgi:hypothetical protein